MTIKLNCDLGESFGLWNMGDELSALSYVDQANLACGFHAGDFSVMNRSVALAVEKGVSVGAHPGYPDLQGFGRRAMRFTPDEVKNLLLYQIGALDAFCHEHGIEVAYVKPHGALYHAIYQQEEMFEAALQACHSYRKGLPLMVLAVEDPTALLEKAARYDVPLLFEAFADRAYLADATLSPRSHPQSVHHEANVIINQAVSIATRKPIKSLDGTEILIKADSLCVHGDNPASLKVLKELRAALEAL